MKIKKQIVLFVAMLLLWTLAASAQSDQGRRHRFSPEEYVQKAKTYIIREAGLTPTEAAAFFPLYHKMKNQQRKLSREVGNLMRDAWRGNLSEEESLVLLNTLRDKEEDILELEEKYQKKFLKIVPASKLLKVKIAEKKFERKMLSEMACGPRGKKKGNN